MFLKSLELIGFKSFAQKTVLKFPKGVTAIVGPNGSGKSNIIDAIRWILGERETKNLRGEKTEDLIFAGTVKKPRAGTAKVEILFENNVKLFPIDFNEMTVAREISRDGNSTYFLNKSEVRAKDAVDFFARARLGTKGIVVINQGSSDLFVRVSPYDRRIIIEEVLGLKEYQLKKSEAERKLSATYSNLEKIKLMAEEVAPRLRMLKRQVSKYQTRDQKKEELKNAENIYFGSKTTEIKNLLKKHNEQVAELNLEISKKLKKLEVLSEELKKIEAGGQIKNNDLEFKNKEKDLIEKQSRIQREMGRIETRIEFLSVDQGGDVLKKDKMVSLVKSIRESLEKNLKETDLNKIIFSIKSLVQKINDYFDQPKNEIGKELKEAEKEKNDLAKNLEFIEIEIKKIKEQESATAASLENFNQEFKKSFEIKEKKREEIRNLENKKGYFNFEIEKLNSKIAELKREWIRNERDEQEFEKLKSDKILSQSQADEMERQMMRFRAELISIGEIDESLIKEAQEVEAHYSHLSIQSDDLGKASKDLEKLIEELKTDITSKFNHAFKEINEGFNKFFKIMFGGGNARLKLKTNDRQLITDSKGESESNTKKEEQEKTAGIEIELNLPKKRITSLDILSGGEKSLVSIAALFALISVSPPPFLVLDEIDAPLDEQNSRRFANLIKEFTHKVQFIIVTHNRTVMEAADALYGVTMNDDGTSKLLSLKLEN
ncbi:MAG: AAA family ATPase [Patescibacteria group bacterium]|nr:AAA family ATPase [Patescibacteria group bacterium]